MKYFNSREWQNELNLLPDIEAFRQRIVEFEKLDLSGKNIKEIEKLYFELFRIFPFGGVELNPKILNGLKIFRVRKNLGELDFPNLISNYSSPPSQICTWKGRANIEYRPVFYASLEAATAFLESQPNFNDLIYLTEWEIKTNENSTWSSLLTQNLPTENKWKKIAQTQLEAIQKQIRNDNPTKYKELELLSSTISNWFLNDDDYLKSSWIAYKYLYEFIEIDALIYPSVSTLKKSTCIALHPNFVNLKLQFKTVWYFEFIKTGTGIGFNMLGKGKVKNSDIFWTEIENKDLNFITRTITEAVQMRNK